MSEAEEPSQEDFPQWESVESFSLEQSQLLEVSKSKTNLSERIQAKTSEAVLILKNSEEQVYLDNAKRHLQAEELELAQRELDKVEHRAQDKLTLVIQLERAREEAEVRARAAEEARVALIAEQI